MNNHSHHSSDDTAAVREARVLAVVLGEANDTEVAAVEQLLCEYPELRAYRDELLATLPFLRAASRATSAVPDLRMDEARRAALLKTMSASCEKPAIPVISWKNLLRENWGTFAACAAFVLGGAVVAVNLSSSIRTRATAGIVDEAPEVFATGAGVAERPVELASELMVMEMKATTAPVAGKAWGTGLPLGLDAGRSASIKDNQSEGKPQADISGISGFAAPVAEPVGSVEGSASRRSQLAVATPVPPPEFPRRSSRDFSDESGKSSGTDYGAKMGSGGLAFAPATPVPSAVPVSAVSGTSLALGDSNIATPGVPKGVSALSSRELSNVIEEESRTTKPLPVASRPQRPQFASNTIRTSQSQKTQSQPAPTAVPADSVSRLAKDVSQQKQAQDGSKMELFGQVDDAWVLPSSLSAELENRVAPRQAITTAENPFSTFSLNVSDVSFRLAAESLRQAQWPDGTNLRTEEFVNAVAYNDPPPAANEAISLTQEQARHPFAHNQNVLRLSVQTASAGRNSRQPLNLTVLLDTSGSMERADRQEVVDVALKALAENIGANDTVSVLGFARTPRLLMAQNSGAVAAQQLRELGQKIPPEGGTNLELALNAAYAQNRSSQMPATKNTVVLLTDGAANLGDAAPQNLSRIIEENKKQGIGLNCYGIGFDDYNDTMLETLARSGNGRYAYLNNASEAREDFAKKLAGSLQVAAQNVKVQIEFNPARVISYRLLGYEKHRLNKEDFRNDAVTAAELGAAESGTAVYSFEAKADGTGDVGTVRVRYQNPRDGNYHEREWNIPYDPATPPLDKAAPSMQLAATAAFFAEKLQGLPSMQPVPLKQLVQQVRQANATLGYFPENKKLQTMLEDAARLE